MINTPSVLEVPDGALLFDCYAPTTTAVLDRICLSQWKGEKFQGILRYVENLSIEEKENILAHDLGLMTLNEAANDSMHAPSSIYGSRDGLRAVTRLAALSIPKGVSHGLDVEGEVGASKDQVIYYVNSAYDVLQTYADPAMYDGWADPLTIEELYQDLKMRHYYAASPYTKPPAVRGWGLIQEVENVTFAGWKIDIDRHHRDALGDCFHWLKVA